ncbi:DUF1275 domain-containing protein [Tardiphaga alba]|uniref:DUF1275 domain-containing protein n=1 Tax=Tardiphaga alba TaxID=340268 RepID=A0ABX8A4D2_9BRAD|nr:DUF1275 family protein [Tardiphaga alba]QUS38062.1 DUF1275 domain-containing protein [Tardiphaga alba]
MKLSLTGLLSYNGGYTDTAGFLAFQGLFTAHVTGNFVTIGSALALGTSGVLTKLLALPVFCIVVIATRLGGHALSIRGAPVLRYMLAFKCLLLLVGAVLAITLGPSRDGDSIPALAAGLTLVSAMAVQNAVHRIHLSAAPPTTLMTGTTTQLMIDLADTLFSRDREQLGAIFKRLKSIASAVGFFAIGCATAALLFAAVGSWCFVIPPLLAVSALFFDLRPFQGNVAERDKTTTTVGKPI